ncbi:AGE family epimerase/isomerase [Mucilaginibacter gotjawali]|uniref:Mannobiose 2-epimerase n=2 Tax=Mucilaginibacter gotjawali TaxID=1550579 RepID=A0A839SJE3_9SPHI|nr:AGE family epimerase/isomerase [Mucilaginibacter gotjawali]MBB3057394.1 mannobiose 2-epimerase [Mucilaginibacter gotjawali]BAU55487.1 Cellobiose 2-epimerase [Mucilaginibacter gotjawali]
MQGKAIRSQIDNYTTELGTELQSILDYWASNTIDKTNGGFLGRIDSQERIIADAPKGSVLNARILWTFSAAYNHDANPVYLEMANRAYDYIGRFITDHEFGGVFWSVDHTGAPLDTKKQVYAIAFTIYALSEYYLASGIEAARTKAVELYYLLVGKAYDPVKTGYFEAFTREWNPIDDLRLSAKDENEKKTMNTHLHVLEGYTNLYRVWPDKALKEQIWLLLNNFFDHFIDQQTHHLQLFFDENWNRKSGLVSFGHDIEATWLLLEAAEAIGDEGMIAKVRKVSVPVAEATIKGMDADGGLWYEYEPAKDHLIKEKHWWVQAETMIGFYNAWQISGDEKYLQLSIKNWAFVKDKILDKVNGEWFWGINENGQIMPGEDKAGIWKCPYHNSRACLEIIKRTGLFV